MEPQKPLEEMTVAELNEVKAKADRLAAEKRDAEKQELQNSILSQIEESPFTVAEILKGLNSKPRKTVPPKYRSPDNENDTWTGRGRKPQWVVEYLDGGGELDAIEIKADTSDNTPEA